MDSDSAADELYGLDPADFIARRTELVALARAEGDRGLARTLATLRRPPLAAWLINQLVRRRPDVLDELSGFAQRIRSAHRSLAGDQLRALTGERQHVLDDVLAAVTALAAAHGSTVTEAVRQQVRETAEAAIADEGAEAAVLSGRLTDVLSYSGFGAVDVTDAVAVGLPRRERAGRGADRARGPRAVPDPPRAPQRATAAAKNVVERASQNVTQDAAERAGEDATKGAAAKATTAAATAARHAAADEQDLALATTEATTAAGERDAAETVLAEATATLAQLEQAVVEARAAVRAATIARTAAGRRAERAELRRLALQRRISRDGR